MLIVKFSTDNVKNYLQKMEDEYKIRFSDDYKSFVIKYNGGMTPETSFLDKTDIAAFYGFGKTAGNYSFENLKRKDILNELLAKGYFPIATNVFGDFIVLKLTNGSVHLVYHDQNRSEYLSDIFLSFIGKCSSEKVKTEKIMSIEERKELAIQNGFGAKIDKLLPFWEKEIKKMTDLIQEEVVL